MPRQIKRNRSSRNLNSRVQKEINLELFKDGLIFARIYDDREADLFEAGHISAKLNAFGEVVRFEFEPYEGTWEILEDLACTSLNDINFRHHSLLLPVLAEFESNGLKIVFHSHNPEYLDRSEFVDNDETTQYDTMVAHVRRMLAYVLERARRKQPIVILTANGFEDPSNLIMIEKFDEKDFR